MEKYRLGDLDRKLMFKMGEEIKLGNTGRNVFKKFEEAHGLPAGEAHKMWYVKPRIKDVYDSMSDMIPLAKSDRKAYYSTVYEVPRKGSSTTPVKETLGREELLKELKGHVDSSMDLVFTKVKGEIKVLRDEQKAGIEQTSKMYNKVGEILKLLATNPGIEDSDSNSRALIRQDNRKGELSVQGGKVTYQEEAVEKLVNGFIEGVEKIEQGNSQLKQVNENLWKEKIAALKDENNMLRKDIEKLESRNLFERIRGK